MFKDNFMMRTGGRKDTGQKIKDKGPKIEDRILCGQTEDGGNTMEARDQRMEDKVGGCRLMAEFRG